MRPGVRNHSLLAAVAVLALVGSGCADESREDEEAAETSALSRSRQSRESGLKLQSELFEDADSDVKTTYTLTGHLPSSREGCQVIIRRNGPNPGSNNWSSIRVRPLGRSARTIEAHGPVSMGFLFPAGASGSRDTISIGREQTVFESKGDSEDMKMTLRFEGSHKLATLKAVAIEGHDIAGEKKATCEDLKAPFVLDPAEERRVAEAAKRDYERDHPEDAALAEMELHGCDLARPTRLHCEYGNETNEEQLLIVFAVSDGAVGRVVKAERYSDFH